MVPRTGVCAQLGLDGLGCSKETVGCLLSGNGSDKWIEGPCLSKQEIQAKLDSERHSELPKVFRCFIGCLPRWLPQRDIWSGSGMALLRGKDTDEGPG